MPNANFGDQLNNINSHQRQMEMIQRVADVLTQQQSNSGRASASSADSASSGNINFNYLIVIF
jgi:hypothetical protein